ncbi:hypothetical protein [Agrobacterium genomosp. 2]|uniref:Uncharacterized protein n=1 Tax=Agrobacterium genomosp. 2 str. CFBP 5494 TaxID=1183436 RepID=A0A9W5AZ61_9HYPH|nr:hypothetical protein [Agrobacterium genomosp. 2]CUW87543.1 hypothetical protein AGR2A_Cc120091 [Agrobacterium genomosp. 2 str. CFBP 5494]
MAKDDLFQFDLRDFTRNMKKIEKQVLPTAQAGFLNGIAFGARRGLLAYADKNIKGGPNPWTKKGFVVEKATPQNLEASVSIRPEQARYMTYLINGGVRRAGDPGASKFDVRVDSSEDSKNRLGNTTKGYLGRIARQARTEKAKRAKLAAKRDKLRATGKPTAPAGWKAANASGKPGIFFGEVSGKRGYWQRPQARGGKLKMLVRFSDDATYKPTFRWDDIISDSVKDSDLAKLYSAEITRALKKLNGG